MKRCPKCGRAYSDIVTTCEACNIPLDVKIAPKPVSPAPQPEIQERPVIAEQEKPLVQNEMPAGKPAKKWIPLVWAVLYFAVIMLPLTVLWMLDKNPDLAKKTMDSGFGNSFIFLVEAQYILSSELFGCMFGLLLAKVLRVKNVILRIALYFVVFVLTQVIAVLVIYALSPVLLNAVDKGTGLISFSVLITAAGSIGLYGIVSMIRNRKAKKV